MTTERKYRGLGGGRIWLAALLPLVALVGLMAHRKDAQPSVTSHGDRKTEPRPETSAPAASPAAVSDPARPIPCLQQEIELTVDGRMESACVGMTNTAQNGSVRTYSVETTGKTLRRLQIDVAGGAILSAALAATNSAPAEFECKATSCKGITLGKRDSQGVRIVHLQQAVLLRASGASPEDRAVITGTLTTTAEDQVPGLACTNEGVNVTAADGAAATFCPKGGAGFELVADGGRVYRFTSLDGESILVGVGQDQRVRRVEYQGDTTLSCVAEACFGAHVSQLGVSGERTVTFAGTTLAEGSQADGNTTLNGTLKVPDLE